MTDDRPGSQVDRHNFHFGINDVGCRWNEGLRSHLARKEKSLSTEEERPGIELGRVFTSNRIPGGDGI
jgi:hypothetical protein